MGRLVAGIRGPSGRMGRRVVVVAVLLLLVATVVVATCGGTGTTVGGGAAGASSAQVIIKNFAFDPSAVTVKIGGTVTWINQDSAPHTVVADKGAFTSPQLATGETFSFTFTTPGPYPYYCNIHPSMTGVVTVR